MPLSRHSYQIFLQLAGLSDDCKSYAFIYFKGLLIFVVKKTKIYVDCYMQFYMKSPKHHGAEYQYLLLDLRSLWFSLTGVH